jgi:cell wall-associated NlpC family hydrolase
MNKIDSKIYSDLIGCPFRFHGRDINTGLDCLGLIYVLYERLNVPLPHVKSVIDRKLREAALEEGKNLFVKLEDKEPGCVVGFRVAGIVNHVGMVLDNNRFIHIQKHKRACIERLNDIKWASRIEGFYRFKERDINE